MRVSGEERNDTATSRRLYAAVAPLAGLMAAAGLQWLLASRSLYAWEWQSPSATWNVGIVAPCLALFAAVVLLIWPTPQSVWHARPANHPLVALGLVLVIGLALRVYALADMPPGFFQDEAINGNDALALGRRYGWELWSFSISGRPTLFLYLVLGALKVFGRSYLALKVIPIGVGVATVLAVYALARELFTPRVALWAAFFLAASRWHVHYSRMAWEAICVPLFATLAFLFLVRGIRRSDQALTWFSCSGTALAAGLYTYAGFRAIPVAFLLFVASYATLRPRRFLQQLLPLTTVPVIVLLLTAPLISFAVAHPADWWGRYREVVVAGGENTPFWAIVMHQIAKSGLSLNSVGDALVRHNLPLAPHFDPITGFAFIVGLALLLTSGPRLPRALLGTWLGAVVVLVATTGEAPHATRLLALLVPAIVVAAVGAAAATEVLCARLPATVTRPFLAAVVATTVALNAHTYFVQHAADPGVEQGFNMLARGLCDRVAREVGAAVFWTEDIAYWARPQCEFLAPNVNLALEDLTVAQLLDGRLLEVKRPLVVIVGPNAIARSDGAIRVGPSGIPSLDLKVTPDVARNRAGQPIYYYYRLE